MKNVSIYFKLFQIIETSSPYKKTMKLSFPRYTQHDTMDCGPICLRMVAAHYGRIYSLENLRGKSLITCEGTSMLGFGKPAEHTVFLKCWL